MGALGNQEKSADYEDEIAPGNLLVKKCKKRGGETDHPSNRKKQDNAHYHRQAQTEKAGCGLLRGRQFAGKNGDEDNVIDAENDFQSEQRGKSHPSVWIHEPIHDLFPPTRLRGDFEIGHSTNESPSACGVAIDRISYRLGGLMRAGRWQSATGPINHQ